MKMPNQSKEDQHFAEWMKPTGSPAVGAAPRRYEWDALDKALLQVYGKPQGTNAQAILNALAQDGYAVAASSPAVGLDPERLARAVRMLDDEWPHAVPPEDHPSVPWQVRNFVRRAREADRPPLPEHDPDTPPSIRAGHG